MQAPALLRSDATGSTPVSAMEAMMSTTEMRRESAKKTPSTQKVETKLEVVILPVSDVERAKRFYQGLGWRLDADFTDGKEWRAVQLTPPGSQCSIVFGNGVTAATPG